jgi:hypothetical protein
MRNGSDGTNDLDELAREDLEALACIWRRRA